MKNKGIKILPIALTLAGAGVLTNYLDKDNSNDNKAIIIDDIADLDSSEFDYYTETTNYTTTFATTTMFTTTTTTTTTENIYKDIMFLNGIDNNYDISEINDMIVKYSSYADISYDEAVSILHDGFDINDHNSLEDAIMRTIFERGCDLGLISTYCIDGSIKTREISRDEQERIMLDMCDVIGISDDYKKIVLAVFRWETGHGDSDLCRYCNNYGAVKVGNNFGIYQTPEFGMYRAIKCIYGHILNSNNKGYYDAYNVIRDMSYRYCYDTADEWTIKISNMYDSVSNDYDFNSKQYTKKYEN